MTCVRSAVIGDRPRHQRVEIEKAQSAEESEPAMPDRPCGVTRDERGEA
jgi:hypothetical protein